MKSCGRVCTVWFTGLPSSGKTTLAQLLSRQIRKGGAAVDVIDGDRLRAGWCADLGFSKKDREMNVRRAAVLARLLNDAGIIALVALVSPYRHARADARKRIGPSRFIEAFVRCPLSVCKKRDVKGLYRLAKQGKILRMTGTSDIYEAPLQPDWVMDTSRWSPANCVSTLSETLRKKGLF